jgi:hypothetical protein
MALPLSSLPASAGSITFPVTVYVLPNVVEGQVLGNVQVGSFTDPNCANPTTQTPGSPGTIARYTGTVDWGDGVISTATFGGTCQLTQIQGTHTYTDEMTGIHLTLRVTDTGTNPSRTGFGLGQNFNVGEGDTLSGSGASAMNANAGTALTNAVLATFTDGGFPLNVATDFSATIDWGDGTPLDTSGNVSGIGANNSSPFVVKGTHTYRTGGTYAVKVTMTDDPPGTATAFATTSVVVASVDRLTGTPVAISTVAGQSFVGAVGTFIDTYTGAIPADFTATIDWGDNTGTSVGTITGGNGSFTVSGAHTYVTPTAAGSTRPVIVRVSQNGAVVLTINSTATVAPAAGSSTATGGTSSSTTPPVVTPPSTTGGGTTGTGTGGSTTGTGTTGTGGTPDGGTTGGSAPGGTTGGTPTGGTALPPEPTFTSDNQRFVYHLYVDLLARVPDQGGWDSLTTALNGGTLTRTQAAQALLTSAEYRGDLINGAYQSFLKRIADPDGFSAFMSALNGGTTAEQMKAAILGSQEYFALHGSSNDRFVADMYQDLLGRAADASTAASLLGMLAGGSSRVDVAMAVLTSTDYQATFVNGLYQKLLGRPAGPTELSADVSTLQSGGTDEQVIAGIVSSPEYFAKP